MPFGRRLQRWWDRLLGRPPWYRDDAVTISRTDLYQDAPPPKAPPTPGELTLAEDDDAGRARRRRRSAGVDPYSSDAGFTKPHAWERDPDRDRG